VPGNGLDGFPGLDSIGNRKGMETPTINMKKAVSDPRNRVHAIRGDPIVPQWI